uniref:Uncharacterized protein n=1 Tax=Anguilla anguilla TaxID=7936 RepID=A0A0E9PF87_ANGAN
MKAPVYVPPANTSSINSGDRYFRSTISMRKM